jgi:hypothetical protein
MVSVYKLNSYQANYSGKCIVLLHYKNQLQLPYRQIAQGEKMKSLQKGILCKGLIHSLLQSHGLVIIPTRT